MLKADTIDNYIKDYHPQWVMEMPAGCPPAEIMVANNHIPDVQPPNAVKKCAH